jgi:hypothetical protein
MGRLRLGDKILLIVLAAHVPRCAGIRLTIF